jgi:hypothetical protein
VPQPTAPPGFNSTLANYQHFNKSLSPPAVIPQSTYSKHHVQDTIPGINKIKQIHVIFKNKKF